MLSAIEETGVASLCPPVTPAAISLSSVDDCAELNFVEAFLEDDFVEVDMLGVFLEDDFVKVDVLGVFLEDEAVEAGIIEARAGSIYHL